MTTYSYEVTQNGYMRFTAMAGGYLVTRLYVGYTRREAERMFLAVLKEAA